MSQAKSVIKKIKSTGPMRALMGEYFQELDEAAQTGSAKVAWCTSVGPAELLRSFGFRVYFPENHGALLGSSRMAADLIPAANAIGYSPDICSYLTSDVGSFLRESTPLTKAFGMKTVPKPDVLVYNTNQCRDVQDWFGFYQREFNVPSIGITTPRSIGDVTRPIVEDLPRQDTPGFEYLYANNFVFGSPHAGTFNMARCDGAVLSISYDIDVRTHSCSGIRNDGEKVMLEE